jgi:hypothetical protein
MPENQTQTKPVYVLTATDGDIVLRRPSTSRSTIISAFATIMAHQSAGGNMKWKMSVETEQLTDAEISMYISAFDNTYEAALHGKLDFEVTDGLNEIQMLLATEVTKDDEPDA